MMPIQARRVFRVSLTMALSLAISYGMALPLPFMAPLFALMLTAPPAPPMGIKGLIGLILLVLITTGIGLLLIPMLIYYPFVGVLIVAVGLYQSTYISVHQGKAMVGMLLTIGFTLIPIAGAYDFNIAIEVIQGLAMGIGLAILCQWIVYPWLPEDLATVSPATPESSSHENSNWTALRVTLIVLPPFLIAMTNPSLYLKVIMKAVSLGQQGSEVEARQAGRELLGSTFLGGGFAILFWLMLQMLPTLWMFFWWTFLFGTYFMAKFYAVTQTRFTPSFWLNVAVTMLILVGSAVQDSANGDDVYSAFIIRMGLFIGITLYAWAAISFLERRRTQILHRRQSKAPAIMGSV